MGVQCIDISVPFTLSSTPRLRLVQLCARYENLDSTLKWIKHKASQDYETRLEYWVSPEILNEADLVLFPEYSCPLHLFSKLAAHLQNLPVGKVVVLPLEHANIEWVLEEFKKLKPLWIPDFEGCKAGSILNIATIWVGTSSGVSLIVQPKLFPAAFEERFTT